MMPAQSTVFWSGGFNQQTGRDLEDSLIESPEVVLVDDHPELRHTLGRLLRRQGYRVIELADGDALMSYLGACEEHNGFPDVIVADESMPGYSGTEVLSYLRLAGHEVPYILMTAYGTRALEREADALGAAAVFHKPLDVDALLVAVHLCSESMPESMPH